MSLKRYIISAVEDALTKEMQNRRLSDAAEKPVFEAIAGRRSTLRKKRTEVAVEQIKVADLVFSFNNQNLIRALQRRGKCIASQNFDKMREEEQVINAMFQEFNELAVPTACFITFEEEDGKDLALQLKTETELLGLPMKFESASEPTDIIWENRHFSRCDYIMRQLFAFFIIFILIGGSFILIYIVTEYQTKVSNLFPVDTDCAAIEESYGNLLETYAIQDYKYIKANDD